METQQRLYYLDNVCGLMIFQVILGHQVSVCDYHNASVDFIYKILSFFMFWFFFKGGMMFRDRNVKDVVKVSAKRLLLPYVFFLFVGLVIEAYLQSLSSPVVICDFFSAKFWQIVNNSVLDSVAPCWFLLSLFVARVVFQICMKHLIAPSIIAVVAFIIAYLTYYILINDWNYIFRWGEHVFKLHVLSYIGNMSLGLMCYALGYILREKQYSKWILACAAILFVGKFFVWADIDFRTNNSFEYNYILALLYGVAGCVVINNLFRRIANVRISLLTYIGENSMIYYLVHYPVMFFVTQRFYGSVFNLSPVVRFVSLSCILVIVLWASGILFRSKKFGFLFGM